MSVLMDMEETVKTVEGVLVKTIEAGLGDGDGVTQSWTTELATKGSRPGRRRNLKGWR
jgi:hypothetical protein